MNDEQTMNELGAEAALDLAIEREKLTRSIEKENTATKLVTQTEQELLKRRALLLEELNKQSPLIDYSKDLNEQHKAVLDSLQRKADSHDEVATANQEQADEIAKQTGLINKQGQQTAQTFRRVSKQTSIMGNIAKKALNGVSGFISAQVDNVLQDLPLGPELKAASSFTKSVIPTNKDKEKKTPEKRIQSVSKRERNKAQPTPAPKPQNVAETFQETLKRRDEQGTGRNGRLMLRHLESIDITTQAILKELKGNWLVDFLMRALMMSALVGLGNAMQSIADSLPDFGKIGSKGKNGQTKPDPKKPNPKADPKKTDKPKTDPTKPDPKKSEPTKPQPEAAKTDKPKADPKTQPKPEPRTKTDIPKTEPAKPSSQPKPSKAPTEAGKISKAGKVAETIGKAGKGLSRVAKGIPFLGTALFAADVVQKQMADDRNVGLGHARAIMDGEQDSYKGDYQPQKPEPMKIERGDQPLAEEGIKISAELDKKALEEKKEALKTQALMAQSISSRSSVNQTTVNNISNGGSGSGSSIQPFGNEYQTPHQKGSMIQR